MAKQRVKINPLVSELATALAGGSVAGIAIRDEPVPGSRYRHITVVWDKWKGISQEDRSKAILDAYETVHPDEKWRVLEITLAMGLTTAEAKKLNLKVA